MESSVTTLGPAAAVMRRRLAPLAWCALEVVVEHAHPDDGGLVAEVSVRLVAVELAVAKNTARRALATLRGAGLVTVEQHRTSEGHFDTTSYRLAIPPDVLKRHAAPSNGRLRRPETAEQLSLLAT